MSSKSRHAFHRSRGNAITSASLWPMPQNLSAFRGRNTEIFAHRRARTNRHALAPCMPEHHHTHPRPEPVLHAMNTFTPLFSMQEGSSVEGRRPGHAAPQRIEQQMFRSGATPRMQHSIRRRWRTISRPNLPLAAAMAARQARLVRRCSCAPNRRIDHRQPTFCDTAPRLLRGAAARPSTSACMD